MHFAKGTRNQAYSRYIGRKTTFVFIGLLLLGLVILYSISTGAARIPIADVVRALAGVGESKRFNLIVWQIRLPQVLAAVVAGAGLSVGGAVMQSVLRNPLGSPFTLGISHAAAFGAAFSVMILGCGTMTSAQVGAVTISNPYHHHGYGLFLFHDGLFFHCDRIPHARRQTGNHDIGGRGAGSPVYRRHHVFTVFRR